MNDILRLNLLKPHTPYRLIVLPIAWVLCMLSKVDAQQIAISKTTRSYQWTGMTRTFNDRFHCSNPYNFRLDSSALYRSKKVKKVEILNPDSSVQWMMEFDSTGRLLKTGSGGFYCRYLTVWQDGETPKGESFRSTEYYENNTLQRVDSSFSGTLKVRKDDTVFIFRYTRQRSYKTGQVLNEQGLYYNQLKQPIAFCTFQAPWYRRLWDKLRYTFRRKYSTSYGNTHWYLSSESQTLYLSGYSVGTDTSIVMSCKESVLKWQAKQIYRHDYIPCEKFHETSVATRITGCYTDKARFDEEQKHLNDGIRYTYNNRGLYSAYYQEDRLLFVYRYTYFE